MTRSDPRSASSWTNPRRRAAVVYDDGVAITLLLRSFAAELSRAGVLLGGVLESVPEESECGPGALLEVSDAATGETIPLCRADRLGDCRPDVTAASRAGRRMSDAWPRGAEVVFLTRFGRREAAGEGFSPYLRAACEADVPVLTAVPRALCDRWLAFSPGGATLLDSQLWVLRDWWRDLGARAAPVGNATEPVRKVT